MADYDISLLPAVRVSDKTDPEIRAWMRNDGLLTVSAVKDGSVTACGIWKLKGGETASFRLSLGGLAGQFVFHFDFTDPDGVSVGHRDWPYETVATGAKSSMLLDGCWIDLYHWSEEEGCRFNPALKELTEDDWKDQIRSMGRLGIKGVVIQNLFYIDEYVGTNDMTLDTYHGEALYPSALYGKRFSIRAKNALAAILEAADECGMHVLVGIGLFAWFDFSGISLEWHKRVANELFTIYGWHESFYGYYVSEEIPGSLYHDFPHIDSSRWMEIAAFFKEFKSWVNSFSPTKPIALAPNNIRFHEYEAEWHEILKNVDILLPFAFARDMDHLNIREISDICRESETHFWVDMEIFQNPFDDGLVPKNIDALIREIRIYDDVEQIYGYEYTGLMNDPDCRHNLGGEAAKELYRRYREYYGSILN